MNTLAQSTGHQFRISPGLQRLIATQRAGLMRASAGYDDVQTGPGYIEASYASFPAGYDGSWHVETWNWATGLKIVDYVEWFKVTVISDTVWEIKHYSTLEVLLWTESWSTEYASQSIYFDNGMGGVENDLEQKFTVFGQRHRPVYGRHRGSWRFGDTPPSWTNIRIPAGGEQEFKAESPGGEVFVWLRQFELTPPPPIPRFEVWLDDAPMLTQTDSVEWF